MDHACSPVTERKEIFYYIYQKSSALNEQLVKA
ncbi:hypothetical protein SAMN05443550_105107 [Pedobacter hartonius]|uniref:Uncharacterized protein n=1 Tax=Pedobacter hartonius TaxID=425514 RepID=A0A1H4DU39_9SPHI|nr:hypothetical protein SAMN05443550_105107 [Pedobacter hartonius]